MSVVHHQPGAKSTILIWDILGKKTHEKKRKNKKQAVMSFLALEYLSD